MENISPRNAANTYLFGLPVALAIFAEFLGEIFRISRYHCYNNENFLVPFGGEKRPPITEKRGKRFFLYQHCKGLLHGMGN